MTAFLTFVLLAGVAAAAQEPSLGEVARKNRKAKGPAAARVITNDQIPSKTEPATAGAPTAVPNSDPVVPAAPSHKPLTKSEVDGRISTLAKNEAEQEIIITKFEEELKNPHLPPARRQMYEDTLAQSRAIRASFAKEREVLERALSQMQAIAPKVPAEVKSGSEAGAQAPAENGGTPEVAAENAATPEAPAEKPSGN